MKLYNIYDEDNNFVKAITVRKQKDLKEFENFFNKDIDTINEEIKEKKTVTKSNKEYKVELNFICFMD